MNTGPGEKQLSMIRVVRAEPEPPPPNPILERIAAEFQPQEREALAIADELHPGHGFTRTRDMPTPLYCEVWKEYHRRNPAPQPLNIPSDDDETAVEGPTRKPKKPKQLQEWPLARKQTERLRRLHELALRKYSIPALRSDFLQAEAVRNPQYFGVCPLPGAVESSKLNWPDLLPNPAKQYEKALRAQEILEYEIKYEGRQPLRIPLELKEPEAIAVEAAPPFICQSVNP